MSDEQKHYPWNEGQPTKPDVDALLKSFPPETMTPGWRATDAEIKAIIGNTHRYRTVYSAWIRRLQRDHQVNVYRQLTTGFYVPTADQVFARTHPTLQHIGRSAKKQVRSIAIVKPENDSHRALQDHQGRLLHNIGREAKKARMNLLPGTVQQPLPQIATPEQRKK